MDRETAERPTGIIGPAGENLLREGVTLQRMDGLYLTAIQIQKPRDITAVQKACLSEAELAGETFYFHWLVNKKDGTKAIVDGVTIHATMCIFQNWGKSAVIPDCEALPDGRVKYWADFIDFERANILRRNYTYTPTQPPGAFAKDADQRQRWRDMQEQKAQSMAIRNAVKGGVPAWLVHKVKMTARQAALKGIKEIGLGAAIKDAIDRFAEMGVSLKQLEAHLGSERKLWTPLDILTLRSVLSAIDDGIESPLSVFGETGAVGKPQEDQWSALFWGHLEKHGVAKNDGAMKGYIADLAGFMGSDEDKIVSDAASEFEKNPKEAEKFVATFRARQQKKQPPPGKEQPKINKLTSKVEGPGTHAEGGTQETAGPPPGEDEKQDPEDLLIAEFANKHQRGVLDFMKTHDIERLPPRVKAEFVKKFERIFDRPYRPEDNLSPTEEEPESPGEEAQEPGEPGQNGGADFSEEMAGVEEKIRQALRRAGKEKRIDQYFHAMAVDVPENSERKASLLVDLANAEDPESILDRWWTIQLSFEERDFLDDWYEARSKSF